MLWKIACSGTLQQHRAALEALRNYDLQAYDWVTKAVAPSHWCKAFISHHTKSDMMVNNICASFNSFIVEARDMPIISMVESIREKIMERIQRRRTAIVKYSLRTCPRIRAIITERMILASSWKSIWNGGDGYQLTGHGGAQFVVDMKKLTCSCGLWQLSGIPCAHAITPIHKRGLNPYTLIDSCYKRETFSLL